MSILRVENLSHSFGGLKVLDNIFFTLEVGERVALIGPNGAGKTTVINVLSGVLPCQSGRIYVLGQDITKMPPHGRAALGLARSFQINTLFPNLSLLTNVILAIQGVKADRFQMLRAISSYTDNFTRAKELLDLVGLWEKRDNSVTALSHGEQREVEILLALASQPKLLMLDEPSAGLSATETDVFIDMMRHLVKGTTVFFCAHDMNVVFGLAERVIVLYYGRIIAQGTAEEIQKDPEVMEIYLGVNKESA